MAAQHVETSIKERSIGPRAEGAMENQQHQSSPAVGRPPQSHHQRHQAPVDSVPTCTDSYWHYNVGEEIFSRKVFVGGLPMDCNEEVLLHSFGYFGALDIDWPRNEGLPGAGGGSPRGYVFLLYENEKSVQRLVDACHKDNDKYYVLLRTGAQGTSKPVQVRPWRLADAEYIVDPQIPVDPRHCVFIGGLPRPVKAVEVAAIVDKVTWEQPALCKV